MKLRVAFVSNLNLQSNLNFIVMYNDSCNHFRQIYELAKNKKDVLRQKLK